MGAEELEAFNSKLQEKLALIERNEIRYDEQYIDGAELVIVAFGTAARVAQSAAMLMREDGLPVGLFRPITLWPFPERQLAQIAKKAKGILVVEMNAGQMLHDVRAAVGTDIPVAFLGRMGGSIPMPDEVEERARTLLAQMREPENYLLQESGNGHPSR
jgi:2-oxoglutarate ferredoxin oxidoreductase subunit alpha